MPELIGLEGDQLRALLGPGEPDYRARQLYRALYGQRVTAIEEATVLPKSLRQRLARETTLGLPAIDRRYDSADGTRRYLLRLADGKTVEAVLMPEEERDTLCLSTQVGCSVDCRFCLTALMGLERNLSAGEIVAQALVLIRDNQLSPGGGGPADHLNIVLMGQGEPLMNLPAVLAATRIVTDAEGVGISQKRITLSTSGLIPKIDELSRASVRPRLAISLNASTAEQREELMPITRKYHLADLLEACRRYPLRRWESLTFEYVLLAGVNDSDLDARRVVRLTNGVRAKVNLIALNPGPGIPFDTPSPERVERFRQIVSRGLPCFVRKPRGRDIYAACGQLQRVAVENSPELITLQSE